MNVRDLIQAAVEHDATVERDGAGDGWEAFQVIAPDGKRWCDGHAHALRVEWDKGQSTWKEHRDESIADAISRMGHGLVSCPKDCECRE